MRGIARTLTIHRTTVARKQIFLGQRADRQSGELLRNLNPCHVIEFDDLETCEKSKYLPVSVIAAVEHKSRLILGFEIATMPSKIKLSEARKAKYLPRKDDRAEMRRKLFSRISSNVHKKAIIKSDQNPHYSSDVKLYFSQATHVTFKGRNAAATGQGEMKEGGFDPLFCLNHTFAMFRARVSRLVRKTWSISKKKEKLRIHLSIYVAHHNQTIKGREAKLAQLSVPKT